MRDSVADLHVSCLTNSFLSVHLLCIMDEAQAEQQALLLFCLMLQLHHRRSPRSCDCADWLRHRAAGEAVDYTQSFCTLLYYAHVMMQMEKKQICTFSKLTLLIGISGLHIYMFIYIKAVYVCPPSICASDRLQCRFSKQQLSPYFTCIANKTCSSPISKLKTVDRQCLCG